MKFLHAYAENFLSFKKVDLILNDQGFVHIQGDNQDDVFSKSNGSGKSSIPDLICYILFGKTTKGLKDDDVVHNQVEKNCVAALSVLDEDTGVKYKFLRYRKHKKEENKIYIFADGKDISEPHLKLNNAKICQIIGMDYSTYCQAVTFVQEDIVRFSGSQNRIKNLIMDKVLDVGIFSSCLKKVREDKKAIVTLLERDKNSIVTLNRNIEHEQTVLSGLEVKQSEIENHKQEKLKETQEKIDSSTKELEQRQDELKDIEAQIVPVDAIRSVLSDHKKNLELLDDKMRKGQREYNMVVIPKQAAHDAKEKELKRIKLKIGDKKDLIGTKCYVCQTSVTVDMVSHMTEHFLEEGTILKDEMESLKKEFGPKVADFKMMQEKADSFTIDQKAGIESCEEKINEMLLLEQKKSNTSLRIQLLEKQLVEYRKNFDEISCTNHSLEDSIDACAKQVEELKEEVEDTKEGIEKKEMYIKGLGFWEMGFSDKGLKSHILDSVVPFLNAKANHYSNILTGGNVQISFSTQHQNKSGDMVEEFRVDIDNRYGGNNYKACSRGERRRIDIAIMMSLHELVTSRSRKKFNICFFDEVFESLDAAGIESAMNLLDEVSKTKESVFVITHMDDLKARFPKSITVTKKDGISRVA